MFIGAFFVLSVVAFTVIGGLLIYSHEPLWKKLTTIVMGIVFYMIQFLVVVNYVGTPKPFTLERLGPNWDAEKALVYGSKIVEGEALYLLLQLPDMKRPMYYVFPWNKNTKEMSESLEKAKRKAKREGSRGIMMLFPFENSLEDREKKFYPLPQPAMPPKTGE